MTPRQKITLIISVVVVIGLVVTGMATKGGAPAKNGNQPAESEGEKNVTTGAPEEELEAIFTEETPAFAKLSEPKEETVADKETGAKLGTFEMKIDGRGYTPNELTVKKGDVVQIRIFAVDADYDFTIPYVGIYQLIEKEDTKTVSFRATNVGTLAFTCRDHCPRSGREGKLIVIP
ncbi:MAG: cupredoxin domain-containing protein [bacterium]|nr:cupredoxin domain-containing protein [bacterium]